MPEQTNNIEGFVLAGGASSRMGCDKAGLRWGDSTFIEHSAITLQTITTAPIAVVGGSETAESSAEFRFLPDAFEPNHENRRGAIIGLQTVFRNSNASWAAVLACDLPFVSGKLVERLAALRTNEFEAIVPVQPDGRWQPLCALYRSAACLPPVEKMLEENIWSVRELLGRIRTRLVPFTDISDLPNSERFFLNVNTPADYKLALRLKDTGLA